MICGLDSIFVRLMFLNANVDRTLNRNEVPLSCVNTLLEWAVGARYYGLWGQHDEPGHVARVILDSISKMFIP